MKNLLFQLVRYSWVGLLNSGLGLFVIWGLMLAGIGPYVANVAGFAAGLTLSFFLNRAWTFRAQDAGWPVFRFLLAFAIAYSANLVILTPHSPDERRFRPIATHDSMGKSIA